MSTASSQEWTRKIRRSLWPVARVGFIAVSCAWLGLKLVPLPPVLLKAATPSRELTDRHGVPLREMRVEDRYMRRVSLDELPASFLHALLAAEDKRFFEHRGVDLLALARAVVGNVRHGGVTSGASTITQQLVKISDPRPRTLWSKLVEAARALRLEQVWTKGEILEAYVNRIDFGNLNIGVAAASADYFGKPVADLSDAEAAFLAGLPRNPTRLNPRRHWSDARRRQETVLRRMEENGWLSESERALARAEKLRLWPRGRVFRAPHFVDFALQQVTRGHQSLATTLDLDLNRFVEETVRVQLAALRGRNVRDGAVVVIDNRTGDVLVLVGSGNYFEPGAGQVNGAIAPRSAGSTFKPFTYLLAMERGATPATIVADVPTAFETSTGSYEPQNYSRHCAGPIRYRPALANSLNIPAVRLLSSLGGAPVLRERLRSWGMTTLERPADTYGLGLTIGNAETRLIELTNAYATLARLGEWKPYRLWLDKTARGPSENHRPSPATTRDAAWLIADILSDNAARAQSFGLTSWLRFDFPVACKTGTSTDFRDNWAIGYTPEFTVGAWAGNFDGTPMQEVSGVMGAAPIMHSVMEHLHGRFGTTWYARPASIVERCVHPLTGKLVGESNPKAIREKFLDQHLPPREAAADYDAAGRVKLGPEYREWVQSAENQLAGKVVAAEEPKALRLLSPRPGTTYFIDPDLPSSRRVAVRAAGGGAVEWESPSLQLMARGDDMVALLTEGRHWLTVRDPASGRHAETWIQVKSF